MKKGMKRGAAALAGMLVLSLVMMTGCGSNSTDGAEAKTEQKAEEKPMIRVAMCQSNMLEGMPDKLRAKFPEVDFEFTMANNSSEYYEYLDSHDDLPDIITVRRFSLLDALNLRDSLRDLSKTDLAATYYQNYLQNYTYEDGTVNWLPAVAEVWCIAANESLFQECGIELPTDYESFIAACEAFEAAGIRGFVTDWSYDYSCLETLEGFNLNALQSKEGKKWRINYESGTEKGADEAIWGDAFVKMEDMLARTGNIAENEEEAEQLLSLGFSDIQSMFDNRETAMIRTGAAEVMGYNERNDDSYVLLPYFGDTEEENWLLSYPYYQAAISAKSEVDEDLLLEVYTYLLGQDCSDALNLGNNVLSYTTEVSIDQNNYLARLSNYIDENRLCIRLANNRVFSASKDVVQGMIRGELDAADAYREFDARLQEETPAAETAAVIEQGYSYHYQPGVGNEAVSSILNSCREVWGTELAIAYPISFSNTIYPGELTKDQLKYLVAANYGADYYLELTGRELRSLVDTMLHYEPKEDGTSGAMIPKTENLLPVTSGFEITVEKPEGSETYSLAELTVNGEPVSDDQTYTIVYCVPSYYAGYIADQAGIEIPEDSRKRVPAILDTLEQYFVTDQKQPAAPTDGYLHVR